MKPNTGLDNKILFHVGLKVNANATLENFNKKVLELISYIFCSLKFSILLILNWVYWFYFGRISCTDALTSSAPNRCFIFKIKIVPA